jgi:oligoendopeptidase F
MTVAETASTFAETLLAERLLEKAQGDEKFTLAWEEASDAASLLINIPARFEFEKNFYEARANGPLSPTELNAMTDQAWRKWYGEELSKTEEQYWMTKMHFNFSGISFYNYPYTFGYLFSLGIYATKEKLGAKFHQAYVDLLRDSGRMTVEDLIQKHLGADIRQSQFWQDSLDIVAKKVAAFEELV